MPFQGFQPGAEEGAGEVQQFAVPVVERLPAEVAGELPVVAVAAEAGLAGQPAGRRVSEAHRGEREAAAAFAGRQPN